jgi:hypothetical protein
LTKILESCSIETTALNFSSIPNPGKLFLYVNSKKENSTNKRRTMGGIRMALFMIYNELMNNGNGKL